MHGRGHTPLIPGRVFRVPRISRRFTSRREHVARRRPRLGAGIALPGARVRPWTRSARSMDMDVVPAVESTAVDAGPAARRELRAAQGFRGHGGRLVPAGTGEAVERGTPRVQERGRREGRARRGPSFSWAG